MNRFMEMSHVELAEALENSINSIEASGGTGDWYDAVVEARRRLSVRQTAQTFYVIKRDEEPRYIGFDSDEDGENVPYFSAFYKSYLYIDKDEAEGDLKAAKEDGWTGLNTGRIVKVRVEEVDE